jgi:hypothetical protein
MHKVLACERAKECERERQQARVCVCEREKARACACVRDRERARLTLQVCERERESKRERGRQTHIQSSGEIGPPDTISLTHTCVRLCIPPSAPPPLSLTLFSLSLSLARALSLSLLSAPPSLPLPPSPPSFPCLSCTLSPSLRLLDSPFATALYSPLSATEEEEEAGTEVAASSVPQSAAEPPNAIDKFGSNRENVCV